jgi:hypothetical protein
VDTTGLNIKSTSPPKAVDRTCLSVDPALKTARYAMMGRKQPPNLIAEVARLIEDCSHTSKSHFNAAGRWSGYHYFVGVPATAFSVAASAAIFKDYVATAATCSMIAAVLTALLTFLKPHERSEQHRKAGNALLSILKEARFYREAKLGQLAEEQAVEAVEAFIRRQNEANEAAPMFSDADRRMAREGIEAGEAKHRFDE